MGNNIKSRLHRKKGDHPGHTDTHSPKSENTNPGRSQIDQQIMSGPNRARAAEAGAPDTAHVPPPTRGVDTTQSATTTARART